MIMLTTDMEKLPNGKINISIKSNGYFMFDERTRPASGALRAANMIMLTTEYGLKASKWENKYFY